MSQIDDELGFAINLKKTRAPRVKKTVKEQKEYLVMLLDDLSSKKHADEDFDILTTVAVLLGQNYEERLMGASMTKELVNGRLNIKIVYNRGV